ncbi:MAG: hypothetical protein V4629_02900 [Pseudomonadota bacterium]
MEQHQPQKTHQNPPTPTKEVIFSDTNGLSDTHTFLKSNALTPLPQEALTKTWSRSLKWLYNINNCWLQAKRALIKNQNYDFSVSAELSIELIALVEANPNGILLLSRTDQLSSTLLSNGIRSMVRATLLSLGLQRPRLAIQHSVQGIFLLSLCYDSIPKPMISAALGHHQWALDRTAQELMRYRPLLAVEKTLAIPVLQIQREHAQFWIRRSHHTPEDFRSIPVDHQIITISMLSQFQESFSSPLEARRFLHKSRDRYFVSHLIYMTEEVTPLFPTGSLVQLENGRRGLVIEQNPSNGYRPLVSILDQEGLPEAGLSVQTSVSVLDLCASELCQHWIEVNSRHGMQWKSLMQSCIAHMSFKNRPSKKRNLH